MAAPDVGVYAGRYVLNSATSDGHRVFGPVVVVRLGSLNFDSGCVFGPQLYRKENGSWIPILTTVFRKLLNINFRSIVLNRTNQPCYFYMKSKRSRDPSNVSSETLEYVAIWFHGLPKLERSADMLLQAWEQMLMDEGTVG